MRIGKLVSGARRGLGLSQVGLAGLAGVSLATLQNVEADRANPSVGTLEKLLSPLGLTVDIRPEGADWDALVDCGLPLSGGGGVKRRVDDRTLVRLVHMAALEIARGEEIPDRSRKEESLRALVLAIRGHFPTFFRRWFGRSPVVGSLLEAEPSGRVIKLARIARARVAEIL